MNDFEFLAQRFKVRVDQVTVPDFNRDEFKVALPKNQCHMVSGIQLVRWRSEAEVSVTRHHPGPVQYKAENWLKIQNMTGSRYQGEPPRYMYDLKGNEVREGDWIMFWEGVPYKTFPPPTGPDMTFSDISPWKPEQINGRAFCSECGKPA